MYGQMYYRRKLKPFVDVAHKAACDLAAANKDDEPPRVIYWTAVAKEHYARESEEVKTLVRKAVQERADEIKLFKEPVLPAGDGRRDEEKLRKRREA